MQALRALTSACMHLQASSPLQLTRPQRVQDVGALRDGGGVRPLQGAEQGQGRERTGPLAGLCHARRRAKGERCSSRGSRLTLRVPAPCAPLAGGAGAETISPAAPARRSSSSRPSASSTTPRTRWPPRRRWWTASSASVSGGPHAACWVRRGSGVLADACTSRPPETRSPQEVPQEACGGRGAGRD